jgi:hypothetical protein
VYSIDSATSKPEHSHPLLNTSEIKLNFSSHHEFLAKSINDTSHLEISFKANPNTDRIVIEYNETANSLQINTTISNKYFVWEQQTDLALQHCSSLLHTSSSTTTYQNCIIDYLQNDIQDLSSRLKTLQNSMNKLSNHLRNYTCEDIHLSSSIPLFQDSFYWSSPSKNKQQNYSVNFYLNFSNAKIWLIDDFITDHECDILEKTGRPQLRRATVAAEDGSSVISNHRKAQQASYDLHYTHLTQDPLW